MIGETAKGDFIKVKDLLLLKSLVACLDDEQNNYFILESKPGIFIQVSRCFGTFSIEYHNNDNETFISSDRDDLPLKVVLDVFASFFSENTEWKKLVDWSRF